MAERLRKIKAMHFYYGADPKGRLCIQCDHIIHGEYHDRRYYKCKAYGCTHSEATDWRKSYPACALVDKPFPDEDKRIIEVLKHNPVQTEKPIEGQITINEILEG